MQMQFMTGTYDMRLVILSLFVAIMAAHTALVLAERVTSGHPRHAGAWLAGGALAMGTGIWAMHFIAMLALSLPSAMGYDFFITALSWLMGVFASAIALYLVSRTTLSASSLLLGSVFMAAGIVGSASAAVPSLDPTHLATLVGGVTLLLLGTLLVVSMLDQRRSVQSSQALATLKYAVVACGAHTDTQIQCLAHMQCDAVLAPMPEQPLCARGLAEQLATRASPVQPTVTTACAAPHEHQSHNA